MFETLTSSAVYAAALAPVPVYLFVGAAVLAVAQAAIVIRQSRTIAGLRYASDEKTETIRKILKTATKAILDMTLAGQQFAQRVTNNAIKEIAELDSKLDDAIAERDLAIAEYEALRDNRSRCDADDASAFGRSPKSSGADLDELLFGGTPFQPGSSDDTDLKAKVAEFRMSPDGKAEPVNDNARFLLGALSPDFFDALGQDVIDRHDRRVTKSAHLATGYGLDVTDTSAPDTKAG